MEILASNRWEDYDWSYSGNRFDWWADGLSSLEKEAERLTQAHNGRQSGETSSPVENLDFSYYLQSFPPLPKEALVNEVDGNNNITDASPTLADAKAAGETGI
jgi:hypothetical protein